MKDSERTPEQLEQKILVRRAHYAKNRDMIPRKKREQWPSIASAKKIYNREYRLKNLAQYTAKDKAYRQANADKIRLRNNKYVKNNRKKANQWCKKWGLKNPDKLKAAGDRYRTKFPEKIRAKQFKRYAIQLGATVGDPRQIVELICSVRSAKDTKCSYCSAPLFGKPIHFDHIIPLSRGGAHCVANLCASCPSCNESKCNKLVSEWKPEMAHIVIGIPNPNKEEK